MAGKRKIFESIVGIKKLTTVFPFLELKNYLFNNDSNTTSDKNNSLFTYTGHGTTLKMGGLLVTENAGEWGPEFFCS